MPVANRLMTSAVRNPAHTVSDTWSGCLWRVDLFFPFMVMSLEDSVVGLTCHPGRIKGSHLLSRLTLQKLLVCLEETPILDSMCYGNYFGGLGYGSGVLGYGSGVLGYGYGGLGYGYGGLGYGYGGLGGLGYGGYGCGCGSRYAYSTYRPCCYGRFSGFY
ncbi:hypothetical protein ACRRTK_019112 [Alexandromys fortis]